MSYKEDLKEQLEKIEERLSWHLWQWPPDERQIYELEIEKEDLIEEIDNLEE